uniref:VWFA domain-containing protein n=1 Tax=Latimeria chalumnae TaxID=7897 RepID=H3AZ87_LATCH
QFDQTESRVGVVQYSHEKTQELVAMGDPNIASIGDLKAAVKDLKWIAGGTYTGEALQFTKENLLRRFGTEKRVALVLTDGRSDTFRDPTPLTSLCEIDTQVLSVGVGDIFRTSPNTEQLTSIACEGTSNPGLSLQTDNYALLLEDSFLQNVTSYVCRAEKKCPDYTCPIVFELPADISIVMDSSTSVGSKNFETTKKFVKRLAERFLSAKRSSGDAVRVSVVQYSGSGQQRTESEFSQNYTVIADSIDKIEFMNDATDVTGALSFVLRLFRSNPRRGAKKKVLLFSDGRSQGISADLIEKRIQEARAANVELYVLAVGSQVNEANLRVLVTGKTSEYDVVYGERHLFRVPDYPSLLRGVFYQTVSRKISL